ncbi:hypothetical protein J8J40_27345, partial [Mycobacterium tuberculosis]|nr:hypothetical protein [Mycobacterium tuberculosis]
ARITTADDGIVLKTSIGADGKPVGACRRVDVRNSRLSSQSCALKLGTESHGDFADIRFEDCAIVDSNRARRRGLTLGKQNVDGMSRRSGYV